MQCIAMPSPNYDSRDGHVVDMLVLHYTGMPSAEAALTRLCDAQAKVSAHYVVDEDGTIYTLVAEEMRAWHAGVSYWRGYTNINRRSIGIEIVNPGHEFGYRPFPKAQMKSMIALCKEILSRHPIAPRNVVGHSDIAPARKEDPGELFDWARLAREGVGLWPAEDGGRWTDDGGRMTDDGGRKEFIASSVPRHLSAYGYDMTDIPKAILAFQRHFRPLPLSGQWDLECEAMLAALLQKA